MDNDFLAQLLGDPEKLQSALGAVSSMLNTPTPETSAPTDDPSAELLQKALPVLGQILQSGRTAVRTEKRDLLRAVKPFVTGEVAAQMDHAVRLVSLAQMARAAMGQLHPTDGTQSL